jgi:hypothetical protein
MKSILYIAFALLILSTSCTKMSRPDIVNYSDPEEPVINNPDQDALIVQIYFHIKRVAKIHKKHFKDDFGRECTIEVIDEITDRLYIRSTGVSCGYKAIYDITVLVPCHESQFLLSNEAETKEILDQYIMWIDDNISGYYDPFPIIDVTRFVALKVTETKTVSVIYNPILNSSELVKLIN